MLLGIRLIIEDVLWGRNWVNTQTYLKNSKELSLLFWIKRRTVSYLRLRTAKRGCISTKLSNRTSKVWVGGGFIGRSDYTPVAKGLLPKPGGTGGLYDPHVLTRYFICIYLFCASVFFILHLFTPPLFEELTNLQMLKQRRLTRNACDRSKQIAICSQIHTYLEFSYYINKQILTHLAY